MYRESQQYLALTWFPTCVGGGGGGWYYMFYSTLLYITQVGFRAQALDPETDALVLGES